MNTVPVNYAQACSDTLLAEGKAQGVALASTMNAMKAQLGNAQNMSMTDTAKRLALAIDQFTSQIIKLQDGTDRVAAYTDSMVDFEDGTNDDTSAPCFSNSFHKLQNIVSNLDKEIENSKSAREAAISMYETVMAQDANLQQTQGLAPAVKNLAPKASPSLPGGLKKVHESDISGTKDPKNK